MKHVVKSISKLKKTNNRMNFIFVCFVTNDYNNNMSIKWRETEKVLSKTKNLVKISIPTPFPVGPVNVFLLIGDHLVLIDTGPKTKEALQALKRGLQQFGYTMQDIEIVVLTHHHSDHAGLLEQFQHAKIYGHWRNEPWITFNKNFYNAQTEFVERFFHQEGMNSDLLKEVINETGPDQYLSKAKLDGILKEGDSIPGFPDWTVIETPGHAQSHLSFLNETDGTFIAGDTIISHLFPTPLLEPPYNEEEERPKTLLQLRETLNMYLNFNVNVVHSGHGEDIFDMKAIVMKQFNKHEERAQKVRHYLQTEGNLTSFEISKNLFPNAYHRSTYLTMSETIGILDLMASRDEVVAVKRNEFQFEYHLI